MFDQRLSAKKNEIEKVEQKIIFKWAKFFLFLNKTYDSPWQFWEFLQQISWYGWYGWIQTLFRGNVESHSLGNLTQYSESVHSI